MQEIKNAIDYLEPEIISLSLDYLFIVDVQKEKINNVVTSLDADPHLEMATILRIQPKHENNQNYQKAAAPLIRNLLLDPIQVLLLLDLPWVQVVRLWYGRDVLVVVGVLLLPREPRIMRDLRLLVILQKLIGLVHANLVSLRIVSAASQIIPDARLFQIQIIG